MTDISAEGINKAITQINEILLNTAKKSRFFVRQKAQRKHKAKGNQEHRSNM